MKRITFFIQIILSVTFSYLHIEIVSPFNSKGAYSPFLLTFSGNQIDIFLIKLPKNRNNAFFIITDIMAVCKNDDISLACFFMFKANCAKRHAHNRKHMTSCRDDSRKSRLFHV
ncbi:hypothetical protein FORC82_p575 (plasmid) [Escherichia coli]|nr:hypothetical protein FORC82_p564 [Escherichia coli]QAZ75096.1 hypothetical protein FORC82_p575 [Escherichia coli]